MNLVQEVEEKITQMSDQQFQELQTWLDDYESLRWGIDLKQNDQNAKEIFLQEFEEAINQLNMVKQNKSVARPVEDLLNEL